MTEAANISNCLQFPKIKTSVRCPNMTVCTKQTAAPESVEYTYISLYMHMVITQRLCCRASFKETSGPKIRLKIEQIQV